MDYLKYFLNENLHLNTLSETNIQMLTPVMLTFLSLPSALGWPCGP